jgi:hypothetical protein
VEVEWLILADSAQVIGNKLYLLGGGWDMLRVKKGPPFVQNCSIAVSVKVPWDQTNERHSFEIEIISEEQISEEPKSLAKLNGQFEVGRPPGIPRGREQRIQLAVNMALNIDSIGTKTVITRIDGTESKRINFNVVSA